jgi:hypothetical protein
MDELENARACMLTAIRNIDTPKPAYYLDTEWLKQFDSESLSRFVADLQQASSSKIPEIIHRWHVTAVTLKNPRARQVLLSPQKRQDYVYLLWPTLGGLPARTPMIDP